MSEGEDMSSSPRLGYEDFVKRAPEVRPALLSLSKIVADSGIEGSLVELLCLRASQLNGCAFCVQIHLNKLRKLSVDPVKIDLIAVWREAGVFSPREKSALQWAEILTSHLPNGPSDEAWAELLRHFSHGEATNLTIAIATINAWNRLGAAFRFAPPIPGLVAV
jgi:AhpD family alkylhydroperoxidase